MIAANDNSQTAMGAMLLDTLMWAMEHGSLASDQYAGIRAAVYWLNADEFDPKGIEALAMLADILDRRAV